MSSIIDYQIKQDALLKDGAAILTQPEKDIFIQAAVKLYSRHRPLERAADLAGNGGFDYPLPAGWIDGFSEPVSVEYPVGTQQPEMVPMEDLTLYRSPTALMLRFLRFSPAIGQTARLIYTTQHVVNAGSATIPTSDEDAVSALAASYACEALANSYAQTQDPTIAADSVDYKSKAAEYTARAKRYMAIFTNSLGIKDGDVTSPASGSRAWPGNYSWGEDRLLHPRARR